MPIDDALQQELLDRAFDAARRGHDEGGIPIGAVVATADGTVVSAASNRYVQTSDWTAHAEICAVRDAGNRIDLRTAILATTMMPCWMCAGMVEHLGIPTVIVGDDESWPDGALDWLRTRDVEVIVRRDPRFTELVARWAGSGHELWSPPAAAEA
jgi:cytosine/creatinine deaminase